MDFITGDYSTDLSFEDVSEALIFIEGATCTELLDAYEELVQATEPMFDALDEELGPPPSTQTLTDDDFAELEQYLSLEPPPPPPKQLGKRKRSDPPLYPRACNGDATSWATPVPMEDCHDVPEEYTKTTNGPCCLCHTTETGKNGWRMGFLGKYSFCSSCHGENAPCRKALFYRINKNGKLVIIGDSQRWLQERKLPRAMVANARIQASFLAMSKDTKNYPFLNMID